MEDRIWNEYAINTKTNDRYDENGYDKHGFDKNGIHKITLTKYDENGYDRFGFDEKGYSKYKFDISGRFYKEPYLLIKNLRQKEDLKRITSSAETLKYYLDVYADITEYSKSGNNTNFYLQELGIKSRIDEGIEKHGFDENGIHKDTNTMYDENGFNFAGFNKNGYDRDGFDIYGYNIAGFDEYGYDYNGRDNEGYDREGYNKKDFNREGINKYTGTELDKDGKNKDGVTPEEIIKREERRKENKERSRRNYLGLLSKAEKLATGELTVVDYIKTSKMSIDDLIIFAKKERMSSEIIRGLYSKKDEYKKYTKPFVKSQYLSTDILIINGQEVRPTEEDVNKCIAYLKEKEILICDTTVRDTVKQYLKGENNLTIEEKTDNNPMPVAKVKNPAIFKAKENKADEMTELESLENEQKELQERLQKIRARKKQILSEQNKGTNLGEENDGK